MIIGSMASPWSSSFFFFNDTATTEIYTLSLHDALPICPGGLSLGEPRARGVDPERARPAARRRRDRKSTRLNSSHLVISYAVFCLKKKKSPELQRRQREERQREGDDPEPHDDLRRRRHE